MKEFEPLILIIEDDIDNAQIIIDILKTEKYQIAISTSAEDALDKLKTEGFKPNTIMLDLGLPGMSGEKLLSILTSQYNNIPVIITTGRDEPQIIVKCIKNGAVDYLVKPLNNVRTITSVQNAIKLEQAEYEKSLLRNELLQDTLKYPEAFLHIITKNLKMHSIFKYAEAVAQTNQPVLVMGETGTGKELFAKAVHLASKRKGRFIPVNTAGLDDMMFNDTLFGHIKGAFTGATAGRKGLIEAAENGTIFLDEIGDINKNSQVKLLRLLQENDYLPGGADNYRKSKARVVMATNKNLESLIMDKEFRTDLYYRLKSHCIYIPPLRERKDDIPLLLIKFLKDISAELKIEIPKYSENLIDVLKSYSYPGNVREMRGLVFESVIKSYEGKLSPDTLLECMKNNVHNALIKRHNGESLLSYFSSFDDLPDIDQVTHALISEAMIRAENNKSSAAKMINMTRGTLRNRLEEYDIKE